MKKFILSTAVILGFITYALNQNISGGVNVESATSNNPTVETVNGVTFSTTSRAVSNTTSSKSTTKAPSSSVPVTTPVPVVVNNGKYRNSTYAGSSEYAYSDYIQVSAVISGGKLTDVQFPSSTGGPGRSRQIYSYAMPQLKSEAISAQSANIDTVSGATYTSSAFQKSLASALAQAVN
ncbi:MAG: FMN-binding protein [bacterium]